jgi:hypothetical protein
MDYSIIQTPNSRLIYLENTGFPFDWQKSEYELEKFIEDQAKLKFANLDTYFYFFLHPDHEGFIEENSWVAKEIVGNPQTAAIDSEIQNLDLDRGMAYQYPLNLTRFEDFFPQHIAQSFIQFRNLLEQESIEIASTWRLRLKCQKNALEVYLEVFKEQTN